MGRGECGDRAGETALLILLLCRRGQTIRTSDIAVERLAFSRISRRPHSRFFDVVVLLTSPKDICASEPSAIWWLEEEGEVGGGRKEDMTIVSCASDRYGC